MSTLPFILWRRSPAQNPRSKVRAWSFPARIPDLLTPKNLGVFTCPTASWKSGPGFSSYLTASGWGLLLAPSQARACLVPTRSWKKQSYYGLSQCLCLASPSCIGTWPGFFQGMERNTPVPLFFHTYPFTGLPAVPTLHCAPSFQSLPLSSNNASWLLIELNPI